MRLAIRLFYYLKGFFSCDKAIAGVETHKIKLPALPIRDILFLCSQECLQLFD